MFSRECKLRKDKDFKRIFKKGVCFREAAASIRIIPNDVSINRFAFVVGTKISKKAVIRNKIRRRMENFVQTRLSGISAVGYDVVFVAHDGHKLQTYAEIGIVTEKLIIKAGLLAKTS